MRSFQVLVMAMFLSTGYIYAQEKPMDKMQYETATFAGGCFWCMQPFLDHLKGVKQTVVGYTGGHTKNPTYEQVCSGTTGHAEAIQVTFDPSLVSFEKVINIFWHNIDPTAKDAQFVDHGTQYRSAVFYHNEEQKRIAEKTKAEIASSGKFDQPLVTEIVKASAFYPAEEHHQGYYKKNAAHYSMYHDNSGRDEFLDHVWGKGGH